MSGRDDAFPDVTGFRIEGVLGRGSMAVVYRARRKELDRPVALKVLRADLFRSDKARERILREARLAARINHPHVVRVFDAGIDGGQGWLEMQLVEGKSLRNIVVHDGPLRNEAVWQLAREILSVLVQFERVGLVHRDVKPGNIMMEAESGAILGDFGLATVTWDERYRTKSRAVGTPAYMAPEQAGDPDAVTHRSELFSLGATLYHAVTGVSAFDAATVGEVITKILYHDPPNPSQVREGVDPAFDAFIMPLLEKEPRNRPTSARVILQQLNHDGRVKPRSRQRVLYSMMAVVGCAALITFAVLVGSTGDEKAPTDPKPVALAELSLDELLAKDQSPETKAEVERRFEDAITQSMDPVLEFLDAGQFEEALDSLGASARDRFAAALDRNWERTPDSWKLRFEASRSRELESLQDEIQWQHRERVHAFEDGLRQLHSERQAEDRWWTEKECRDRIAALSFFVSDGNDALFESMRNDALEQLNKAQRTEFLAALDSARASLRLRKIGDAEEQLRALYERSQGAIDTLGKERLAEFESEIVEARKERTRTLESILSFWSSEAVLGTPLDRSGRFELRFPRRAEPLKWAENLRTQIEVVKRGLTVSGVKIPAQIQALRSLLVQFDKMATHRNEVAQHLGRLAREEKLFVVLADRQRLNGVVVIDVDDALGRVKVRRGDNEVWLAAEDLSLETWRAFLGRGSMSTEMSEESTAWAWAEFMTGRFVAAQRRLSEAPASSLDKEARAILRLAMAAAASQEVPKGAVPNPPLLGRLLEVEAAQEQGRDEVLVDIAKEIEAQWSDEPQWRSAHAVWLRGNKMRASARLAIAKTLGSPSGLEIIDLSLRRFRLRLATGDADEPGIVTLPAGWSTSRGEFHRRRAAAAISPASVPALTINFTPDLTAGFELSFELKVPTTERPRWIAMGVGKARAMLLSRLMTSVSNRNQAWHGWEGEMLRARRYGQAVLWVGEIEDASRVLRATLDTPSEKIVESGEVVRFLLRVFDEGKRLSLSINGRRVAEKELAESPQSGPISVSFARPSTLRNVEILASLPQ